MGSIYSLTGEFLQLENITNNFYAQPVPGAKATDEERKEYNDTREAMETAIIDLLIANEDSLRSKVDGIYKFEVNQKHDIEGLKREARILSDKVAKREATLKRIKESLKNAMDIMYISEIKGNLFTAKLVDNGGGMPITIEPEFVANPKLLPDTLVNIEASNSKIRAAVEGMYDDYRPMVEAEYPLLPHMTATQKKEREKIINDETISRVNAISKYATLAPRGQHVGIK